MTLHGKNENESFFSVIQPFAKEKPERNFTEKYTSDLENALLKTLMQYPG
jgi:hypothetical protein